jgi:predicted nucleotide-binding protein (sugar kinase/HSP70/actin superfamily)
VIGLVGEIFIRLNSYSNQQIIRRIERLGGEVWIADVSEWIWYTNSEEKRKLRERGKTISTAMLSAHLRHWIQHRDERHLLAPFDELFRPRQEVSVDRLLHYSKPYLPQNQALGEMTLNSGKTVALFNAGVHGVIDVSPFTCMNGIVCEVVYPQIRQDLDGLPIRIFYFDGTPFDLDVDLEIFMEQVRAFRKRRQS